MDLVLVAVPFRTSLSSLDYGIDDPGTWGTKMNYLAAQVAAANVGWTVAQTGYYNQGTYFFVLEHTSGAQIMAISGFYSNGEHIVASNDDAGTTANYGELRLAFASSGLGTQLPTITSAFNPYDSATFCADYGFHKFRRFDADNVSTFFSAHSQYYWVLDRDSAYVSLTNFTGSGYGFRNMAMFVDETTDPWLALADPADSGGPFVIYFINQNEGPRPASWHVRMHPDGDLYAYSESNEYSDGYYSRRTGDWQRQWVLGEYAAEYWDKLVNGWEEPIALIEFTHPTLGRKGIIKPNIGCFSRIDIGCYRRFEFAGETGYDMLEGDRREGFLFPWPKDEPWVL